MSPTKQSKKKNLIHKVRLMKINQFKTNLRKNITSLKLEEPITLKINPKEKHQLTLIKKVCV